jgi:hypothetical protein
VVVAVAATPVPAVLSALPAPLAARSFEAPQPRSRPLPGGVNGGGSGGKRDSADVGAEREAHPGAALRADLADSAQVVCTRRFTRARPSAIRGCLAVRRTQRALGAVERAARARHEHLEATTVELPPAELTAREPSGAGGCHSDAFAPSAAATAFFRAASAMTLPRGCRTTATFAVAPDGALLAQPAEMEGS